MLIMRTKALPLKIWLRGGAPEDNCEKRLIKISMVSSVTSGGSKSDTWKR